MKFKTDENVHPQVAVHLQSRGFDAFTVWHQSVDGYKDDPLLTLCIGECRALITLDRDFSDIRRYPPPTHQGIIVLRV
jgi:predicted nuclease of predicted toxin-antitoxin system